MKHSEWSWNVKGAVVFAQSWTPDVPEGVLCVVHGFAEHSGRYETMADVCCTANFAVMTFDLPGHGKSGGRRGHIESFGNYVDTLETAVLQTRKLFPKLPIFLFGHDLGGNIIANFLSERRLSNIAGAVIAAPFFKPECELLLMTQKLIEVAAKLFPSWRMKLDIQAEALSHDCTYVKNYKNDPLVLKSITVGAFTSIIEKGNVAIEQAHKIKTPLLLMHGTADWFTSIDASREFYSRSDKSVVILKEWEGLFHELHREAAPHRQEVMDYMLRWLQRRIVSLQQGTQRDVALAQ